MGSELTDALRPNASPRERNNALAALAEATRAPDAIDVFRIIRKSGARRHADTAKAVVAELRLHQ